jgi:putative lipoic acid-binding regulatory protein
MFDATEQPLEFPVTCRHRVVTRSGETYKAKLTMTIRTMGIDTEIIEERRSSKGTYSTYTFTVIHQTRDDLRRLMHAVGNVDGVKTVL